MELHVAGVPEPHEPHPSLPDPRPLRLRKASRSAGTLRGRRLSEIDP
jgi:hypothetical protein